MYINLTKKVFKNKVHFILPFIDANNRLFLSKLIKSRDSEIYDTFFLLHTVGTKEVVVRGGHPPFDYRVK